MGIVTVDDIIISPLKRIDVQGGDVLHGMKMSDTGYNGFGEAYFSWVKQNYVKAWKLHTRMTLNLVVPVGEIQFTFTSPDATEFFRTEVIGITNYVRLTVPPGLWFGFKGVAAGHSLLLNIANVEHEANEAFKKEISDFKFNWNINNPK